MGLGDRVLLAFLGSGSASQGSSTCGYALARYAMPDGSVVSTRFSLIAALAHAGPQRFGKLVVWMTPEARDRNWAACCAEAASLGIPAARLARAPAMVATSEATDPGYWLALLMGAVNARDEVVVDLTHGYRAAAIAMTAALAGLQQVRPFTLRHCWSGQLVDAAGLGGAVGARMIDLAGALGLPVLAAEMVRSITGLEAAAPDVASEGRAGAPAASTLEEVLVWRLRMLCRVVRQADFAQVGPTVDALVDSIRAGREESSRGRTGAAELVLARLDVLGEEAAWDGVGRRHFDTQFALASAYLRNGLVRQAASVLREILVSFGVLGSQRFKHTGDQVTEVARRRLRERYGACFMSLVDGTCARCPGAVSSRVPCEGGDPVCHEMCGFWDLLEREGLTEALRDAGEAIRTMRETNVAVDGDSQRRDQGDAGGARVRGERTLEALRALEPPLHRIALARRSDA